MREFEHHAARRLRTIDMPAAHGSRLFIGFAEAFAVRHINNRILQALARMNRLARDNVRIALKPKLAIVGRFFALA